MSNTSIQDAYYLAWKPKLVLEGKAGPGLLESYSHERQPIGRQIVDRANKSIQEYDPIFETLGLSGALSGDDAKRRVNARKQATVEAQAHACPMSGCCIVGKRFRPRIGWGGVGSPC